jgi:hypothetical protein
MAKGLEMVRLSILIMPTLYLIEITMGCPDYSSRDVTVDIVE